MSVPCLQLSHMELEQVLALEETLTEVTGVARVQVQPFVVTLSTSLLLEGSVTGGDGTADPLLRSIGDDEG